MAVRITVQSTTVEVNRRRKIFPFEGAWTAAAASDIRAKIAGAGWLANSQLAVDSLLGCAPSDFVTILWVFETDGVLAQLVERLVRNEKVRSSSLLGSTIRFAGKILCGFACISCKARAG